MGNIADEITNNIADGITNSLAEESKFFEKTDGWPLYMEGEPDEEELARQWDESDDEELAREYARDDGLFEQWLSDEEDRVVEDAWSAHDEGRTWL